MIFDEKNVGFYLRDVIKHDRTNYTLIQNTRALPALSFRLSGSGYFEANGKRHDYVEKSVLYLPPNIKYTHHSDKEELIAVIFEVYNYDGRELEFLDMCDAKCQMYFEQLYETWTQKASDHNYRSMAILYKLFAHLNTISEQKSKNIRLEKIKGSVDHLNKSFTDPGLSISAAAELSNMSEVYFRRIFHEEFDCSPLDYVLRLKLDRAKILLEGGYSVKETALLSGFNSYSYFMHFFKAKIGITPAEYKKNI